MHLDPQVISRLTSERREELAKIQARGGTYALFFDPKEPTILLLRKRSWWKGLGGVTVDCSCRIPVNGAYSRTFRALERPFDPSFTAALRRLILKLHSEPRYSTAPIVELISRLSTDHMHVSVAIRIIVLTNF